MNYSSEFTPWDVLRLPICNKAIFHSPQSRSFIGTGLNLILSGPMLLYKHDILIVKLISCISIIVRAVTLLTLIDLFKMTSHQILVSCTTCSLH